MHSIYVVLNTTSEKVYIGQSKDWKNRIRQHLFDLRKGQHHCSHWQKSFNKYGQDAFESFEVCRLESKAEVDEAEKFYIAWFRELGLCYNHMGGGEGNFNPDAETRYKMGSGARGKPGTMTGKKHTPEAHERMKETHQGPRPGRVGKPVHTEESKAKISATHKGRKLTPEHRDKVVAALQKREFTEEYRRKLSEANKGNQNFLGRSHSEETKRNLSEARKGAGNPAYGKPRSEESIRKLKETIARKKALTA